MRNHALINSSQEPEQCLGRTGDEEDALVEQQQRRRAARSSVQSALFIRPRRRVRSSSRTKSRSAQLSAQIHLMSSADLDSEFCYKLLSHQSCNVRVVCGTKRS
jgi:hypothetical protein